MNEHVPDPRVLTAVSGVPPFNRESVVPVTFGRSDGVNPALDGPGEPVTSEEESTDPGSEPVPELSSAAPRSTDPGT
ncbi:hypothetical protein [uncultured Corynebacterium sp.]|uniref:hypothetical protein n=1 Tax=uncultured Corynebacterium sp. TaxID=159447 RepID=UPI0025D3F6AE|nr:hypothetical protein [uncultured Corynebacterium sp.]